MKFRIFGLLLSLALLGGAAPAAAATPDAAVDRFHDALIETMRQGPDLGFQGRYEALAPVLGESFNLAEMARVAAGPWWTRFSDEQQSEFVQAFTRMTVATYANRFDQYSGERFELLKIEPARRDAVVARARVHPANGKAVDLDYLIRQFGQEWKIVDVFLDGSYSELATRRSEYTSILGREGLDGLLRRLERRVAGYAGGG